MKLTNVRERISDYTVKEYNNRHLKKHGQTTGEGAVALLLLELHNFLLHSLHGNSIGSSSVFCFNKFDFGGKRRHFDLVLLLLYGKGQENDLKDERVKDKCEGIALCRHNARKAVQHVAQKFV